MISSRLANEIILPSVLRVGELFLDPFGDLLSMSGIGYLITHAYTVGRTDVVVAGMVSIGAIGAGLDWIFRLIEEKRFTWTRLTR